MIYTGGCLCGALRYKSEQAPVDSGYCHCSLCRRSTSAPVVAFASFPIDSFTYTKGDPKLYRSSPKGRREFCCHCGTQIAYRGLENPETVDVNSGTLDNIEAVEPSYHIYTADSVKWLSIEDDLPRYTQGEPEKS